MHLCTVVLQVIVLLCCVGDYQAKKGSDHWSRKLDKLTLQFTHLINRMDDLVQDTCERTECPVGFLRYKRVCHLIVMGEGNAKSWIEAKRQCQSMGANLISIEKDRVKNYLARYLKQNADHTKTRFYTGLIVTNKHADKPFGFAYNDIDFAKGQDSIRWTATKKAINNSNFNFASIPKEEQAQYHPVIQGSPSAVLQNYYSCVTLVWDVDKKKNYKDRLVYRFEQCTSIQNFICEVRPPRRKCSGKSKSKRHRRSVIYNSMYGYLAEKNIEQLEIGNEESRLDEEEYNEVEEGGNYV